MGKEDGSMPNMSQFLIGKIAVIVSTIIMALSGSSQFLIGKIAARETHPISCHNTVSIPYR